MSCVSSVLLVLPKLDASNLWLSRGVLPGSAGSFGLDRETYLR